MSIKKKSISMYLNLSITYFLSDIVGNISPQWHGMVWSIILQ